jgi:hypothetical protein
MFHNIDKVNRPVGPFPTLEGKSAEIYDDRDDLVAIRASPEEDRLSKVFRTHLALLFVNKRPGAGGYLTYISEDRIRLVVVGVINIILAAAFLLEQFTFYTMCRVNKRD